jgi:hypothetical protein
MEVPKCTRCDEDMESGFILDTVFGTETKQEEWGRGEPKKVFLMGKKPSSGISLPVVTFRCTVCGLLESYAQPGNG